MEPTRKPSNQSRAPTEPQTGKKQRKPGFASLPQDDISIAATRDADHPGLGTIYRLTAVQTLPRPIEEVFPFFADAHNLERLTPDFLRFRVLTPRPIEMRQGAQIRYRLKVRGLPIRWKTTIIEWDPPHKFVDNQDSGPYSLWRHTHTFTPAAGGRATICKDEVLYKPRGWILSGLINTYLVERDVVNIFRHRFKKLEERFPPKG